MGADSAASGTTSGTVSAGQPEAPARRRLLPRVRVGGSWRIWVSVAVVAVFMAVPARMFIMNVLAATGLRGLSSSAAKLGPATALSYGPPSAVYVPGRAAQASDLCVTFEFLGVNPATAQATVGILLGVTQPGKTELRTLEAQTSDITLDVDSNSGVSPVVLTEPIASLLTDPHSSVCAPRDYNQLELLKQARVQKVENVLVLEQPRAFPDDWYEVNAGVTVWAGQGTYRQQLPTSVLMMSGDQDYTVHVGQDAASPDGSQEHRLKFIVQRPTGLVFYTYFIAFLPMAMLIVLGAFCAWRQQIPKPSDVAFGVVATLVAILPLRSVLVPPAITDLTRLDILFGLQAAALVGLSLILVVIWGPVRGAEAQA
jgi:hypothetical protein